LLIGHLSLVIELDYLAIGHVTRDLVDGGYTVGGTVSYAARTAHALGCRTGIVTSAGPDLDMGRALDGITIACIPATATTTFENIYTAAGRRQMLHAVAQTLTPETLPAGWRAAIVHLGPVARECDPALATAFDDEFVGLTPQGWMRCWDMSGRVSRCRWEGEEALLARADAVVLSEEDVAGDMMLIAHYAARTRMLVVTQGALGCTVHVQGRSRHFAAPAVRQIDPTGSGDIFAAAFFTRLQRKGDPWEAARFANCVAARSVTRAGLDGTPTPAEIARCECNVKRNA
jgi:sugar/nucleoside kinase (ribokinase family)